MADKLKTFIHSLTAEKLCIRAVCAWLIVCTVNIAVYGTGIMSIAGISAVSIAETAAVFAGCFIIVSLLFSLRKSLDMERFYLWVAVLMYCCLSVLVKMSSSTGFSDYLWLMMIYGAVIAGVTVYAFGVSSFHFVLGKKQSIALTTFAAVFCACFLGIVFVCTYLGYSDGRWDIGIFTQMFEYMRTTGRMLTTTERNALMSHFGVHISPVYYLLLPIYALFPYPQTLQLCEAAGIASAAIPLYLLCRRSGRGYTSTALICVSAMISPVILCTANTDFHENFFLLPFLLWLFYFIEKDKLPGMIVFSLLVLSIKEDASIYMAFIGLWLIFSKKKYLRGAVTFAGSTAYYFLATYIISRLSDGTLAGEHYSNFGSSPFAGMLRSVFSSPGYFLSQCISEEKFYYLVLLLFPMVFLPLMCKHWQDYILFGPLVIINLASMNGNHVSIFFYYNFGTAAILIYLFVRNLACVSTQKVKKIVACSFVLAFFFALNANPVLNNVKTYIANISVTKEIDSAIAQIPDGASVTTTEMLTPHLYKFKQLYTYQHNQPVFPVPKNTDYVVVDLHFKKNTLDEQEEDYDYFSEYLENDNYVLIDYHEGAVALFRLKALAG